VTRLRAAIPPVASQDFAQRRQNSIPIAYLISAAMKPHEDDLTFTEFAHDAHDALDNFRKSLLSKVLGDAPDRGIWHPNGFAIWPIRRLTGLGTLRLHIWPDLNRVIRPWGPPIHRHGWHLASAVVVGTYRDTLYEGSLTRPASTQWRQMTPYRIDILPEDRRQIVAEEGSVFIRAAESRVISAPGFHYVQAGVFHDTLIPEGQFVATLIIEGEHRGPSPLALEEHRYPPRTHQRELLDTEKTVHMLRSLVNRM
jgi:hypothetical protein